MTFRRLDGMAALIAAQNTRTRKNKGEKDTEFVKRIVNAYMDAEELLADDARQAKAKAAENSKLERLLRETYPR